MFSLRTTVKCTKEIGNKYLVVHYLSSLCMYISLLLKHFLSIKRRDHFVITTLVCSAFVDYDDDNDDNDDDDDDVVVLDGVFDGVVVVFVVVVVAAADVGVENFDDFNDDN